eukprot:TRINITY_DN1021_c0_g1_i1.p2 TRINITY_DN1021_c0_g1~~TRINITY_DN1021_c0_g1_i1.p2  ORF type:complete len:679 (+),score=80.28 TRINITY_DN1021_c0_g1_i1:12719-14755(+)
MDSEKGQGKYGFIGGRCRSHAVQSQGESVCQVVWRSFRQLLHQAKVRFFGIYYYCRAAFDKLCEKGNLLPLNKLAVYLPEVFKITQLRLKSETKESEDEIIGSLIYYIARSEGVEIDEIESTFKTTDLDTLNAYIQNYFIETNVVSVINDYREPESKLVSSESTSRGNPLVEQIKRSIEQYETLLAYQKSRREDTSGTLRLKELLVNQLKEIEQNGTEARNKPLRKPQKSIVVDLLKEDNIEKGLKEIFTFYCKQQLLIGKKATFEQLNTVLSNMNLGEFTKFCKDFGIPLPAIKIKEMFKKTARLSKELDWDLFKTILQRISIGIVEERLKSLTKRLQEVGDELSKEELRTEIASLKNKSDADKLTSLYHFIECSDPAKYRKKMVGMALPFNTRDKQYRIPLGDNSRKYKFVARKAPEEIHQQVELIKKQRVAKQLEKKREEQNKYEKNRKILQRIYHEQIKERMGTIDSRLVSAPKNEEEEQKVEKVVENKKVERTNRNETVPTKGNELTWDLLKDLSYNDINAAASKEEELRLEKLVLGEEIDEEDNEILKKLRIDNTSNIKLKKELPEEPKKDQRPTVAVKHRMPLNKLSKVNKSMENRLYSKDYSEEPESRPSYRPGNFHYIPHNISQLCKPAQVLQETTIKQSTGCVKCNEWTQCKIFERRGQVQRYKSRNN